jgi:outer membrane protein OmpA-like peptidoglycan-associated protein
MKLLRLIGCAGLLTVLITPAHSQAQPAATVPMVLLDEDFRSNEQDWGTGSSGLGRKTLDTLAGTYTLHRPTTGGFYFTRSFALNQAQDFSIEAEVRGNGGLVWGRQGADYNLLRLRPDTSPVALASEVRAGQRQELDTTALASPTSWHTLRVVRTGNELRYELDGTVLRRQPWQEPPGRGIGFYASGPNGELTVRRLRIRHQARPIRLAPNLPPTLKREHLGPPLSDPSLPDEQPLVSANGQWLVFWRRINPVSSFDARLADKDAYLAERRPDGSWGPARALGAPINNAGSNTAQWISADGQELLLLSRYQADGSPLRAAGLSRSRRQANGSWSVPELASSRQAEFGGQKMTYCFDVGNTLRIYSKQLSADAADADLFMEFRLADGSYGPARALGSALNTVGGREIAPFLAPDGLTLYFSSDGHPGYGRQDIFVSRRLDDSWTSWSEPLNLGPAVNTPYTESFFSVAAAGDYAYYNSTGPRGNQDLFRLPLPASIAPKPSRLVRGRVLDARTGQPIPSAEVRYERLPDGQAAGSVPPAAGTAKYEIVLPGGSEYGFRASAPGYLSVNENVDLTDLKQYGELSQDLLLMPLLPPTATLASGAVQLSGGTKAAVPATVTGVAVTPAVTTEEKIALRNVFFVRGQPTLLPGSFPELTRLAQTLKENPTLRIRLEGHTDNVGGVAENQLLSEKRVAAIKAYLMKRGVDDTRLATAGFGGTRPVAPNDTEDNKRKNRRVEFVILNQ